MTNVTYDEQRTAAERLYDNEVKVRVLRGLEALQKVYGEDWVEYIEPSKLDMGNGAQCILGQLSTRHPEGASALGRGSGDDEYGEELTLLSERLGEDRGWLGKRLGFDSDADVQFDDLTDAWRQVIGASD